MLYKFLEGADKEKFDKKYAELRDSGKIAEFHDPILSQKFWDENTAIAFEVCYWEDKCKEIGLLIVKDWVFAVGVSHSGQIILFESLKKFLRV